MSKCFHCMRLQLVGAVVKMTSYWKDGFTILCWNLDAGGLVRPLHGARRNHLLKKKRSGHFIELLFWPFAELMSSAFHAMSVRGSQLGGFLRLWDVL